MSLARVVSIVVMLGFGEACRAPRPELAPPTPDPAWTAAAASVDLVWRAALEVLASRGIPLRSVERPGGSISAGPLLLDRPDAPTWADCGPVIATWDHKPTRADARLLVRPDGGGSAVRVTVVWTATGWDVTRQCEARGAWAEALERQVKQQAERAAKQP